ncbi:MAG: aminoacyl-tRNA hydrolase [Candidatus Wildermuthbacteria bacterium]|nr:aminoacyl-tRNA hydrolase [Candidatus Wildermuthbacteria bacterium]
MYLVVGLGNPGKKYEDTRHNVGSRIVAELELLNLGGVVLAEPTTFMNESGKSARLLTKRYPLDANSLIVIHDDIDLPLGEFKISRNRGSAGHKGVQSIIDALGTKDFTRIRVGICPLAGKPESVEKFVLQNFTKSEEKILKQTFPAIIEKIREIVRR